MARQLSNPVYLASPEKGVDGRTTLAGARAPVITDGRIGDFWLDTRTDEQRLYGPKNAAGWPDLGLIKGNRGWTPVFGAVVDGFRRVQRVTDWQGGEGPKPAVGKYVGATGLVDDIADAIDIRGPEGPEMIIDGLTAATTAAADSTQLPVAEPGDDNAKRTIVEIFDIGSVLDRTSVAHAAATTVRESIKRIRTQYRAPTFSDAGTFIGGATYTRVNSEPAHPGKFRTLDRWTAEGDSDSVNGGWWELAVDGELNVCWLGAKGDGLADDSAAIQAADTVAAAMGKILHFPEGVYPANGLLQTTGWSMSKGAKILYNGPLEGEGVRCSATGLVSGDINIDGAGLEPRTLFYIDGSDNTFGDVNIFNVASGNRAWVVRTVYVTGNRNKFGGVHFLNLINAGNINDSSPQGYVTDATANLNIVENITARNARSAVVNAASGTNIYGDIVAVDAKDNGFYSVAGHATLNSLTYDGDDNAIGFRSGASAAIGTINIIRSVSTSVFFGDCGDITIGEILVHGNANSVLHLNNAATGHIKIGTIKGTLRNAAPFAMPAASGTVESLTIDVVDLRIAVDSLAGFSQNSFIRFDACKGIKLGKFDIDVVLSGISSSTFFYGYVNAALTYNSIVESFRVGMYDADGITPHPTCTFFGRDFFQTKMRVLEGVVNTSAYLAGISPGFFQPGRLVAGAAPTAGTWRRGDLVWVQSPAGTTLGWVCTAAGTPGTWSAF